MECAIPHGIFPPFPAHLGRRDGGSVKPFTPGGAVTFPIFGPPRGSRASGSKTCQPFFENS